MTAPSLLEAKKRMSWTFNLLDWRDKAPVERLRLG
jgi:hypothetical protein